MNTVTLFSRYNSIGYLSIPSFLLNKYIIIQLMLHDDCLCHNILLVILNKVVESKCSIQY